MNERHELYHHGVKDQKWGFRRYQNKDGTWTAEGKMRRRAARNKLGASKNKTGSKTTKTTKTIKTAKTKKSSESELRKKVRSMSDEELATASKRLKAEKEYLQARKEVAELTPNQISRGKKVADHIINKIVLPAVTDAAKQTLTDALKKQGQKIINSASKSK